MTVSNTSATPGAPTGSVSVAADGGSCTVNLAPHGNSASGSCNIGFVPDGTWTVTASYGGDANFAASSGTTSVTVNGGPGPGPGPGPGVHAPVFTADNPPGFAISGQSYSYTFQAVGTPPIRYSLSGPFWLHINPFTGTVSGTVPNFGGSFGYTVTATNNIGSTSRSFTVFVRQPIRHHNHANVSTSLSCTSKVHQGQRGNCTLWVTDNGNGAASDVTAQIALPKQLRADYCSFLNFGCSIFNNTASENLGTLYPGQTKSLTVTFTARTRSFLWGNQNPFAFTVKVVGSASSNGGFFGRGTSYSTAYVTIVPFF